MRRAEDTKTSVLYEILQNAVIRGIGNCTQVSSRVTDFLKTGIMPITGWRNRLPDRGTNRDIDNVISDVFKHNRPNDTGKSDVERLLWVLNGLLEEDQHVQVSGKMVGRVYETLGIGHIFNAIKIDGKVKIVDCYQGVSLEPWLRQAWNEPEVFLSYFSNFKISNPEESQLSKLVIAYLKIKMKVVNSNFSPSVWEERPISSVKKQFSFFNTEGSSQHPENSELIEDASSSFKPRS